MSGATSAAILGTLKRTKQWGWLAAVFAGVVIAVFAGAKSQPQAQPNARDEMAVLAADAALGQAMRGGDKALARRLLSLQFTYVDAGGKVHARRDFLADLKGAAVAPPSDAKVRNYGLLAMVTGHRKSVHGDEVFFLDVWARQKGTWRALVMQDVGLAAADASAASSAHRAEAVTRAALKDCKNPCQAIPYRVRSAAEQEIVNAYQAIAKAVVAHDADAWESHVADAFVLYGSGQSPVAKAARIAAIKSEDDGEFDVTAGEVQTMRLSVYGDGAVMIASQKAADNSHTPYRAARVFVKRNGRWQMAISTQTDIE